MSQLTPFVRAFRALAASFEIQADNCRPREGEVLSDAERQRDLGVTAVLNRTAQAFAHAATDLEQQIAADLARTGRLSEADERAHNGGYTVEESEAAQRDLGEVPSDSAWQPSDKPLPLGSLNPNNGEIFSTHGWVSRGRVWVTKEQADRADYCGWRMTGKVKDFQGSPLYEVMR